MMNIIGWIVFGLIVGILARFFMPGRRPMGMLMTILLGIGGSFFGGMIANLLNGGDLLEGRTVGWIGSILGAIVLLFLYGRFASKTE